MRFAYTNTSGNTCVVHAAPKKDLERVFGELSDAQYKEFVINKSIPSESLYSELSDDFKLPSREFRDAWKLSANTIEHDLEKARNIQLNRIRAAREPKLKALDLEFMLALEKGLSTAEIVTQKHALRDLTEPLKAMVLNSIDDVKAAWPQELK